MSIRLHSMIFEVGISVPNPEISVDAAITILSVSDEWRDIAIVGYTTIYNSDDEADETYRDVPLVSVPADLIFETKISEIESRLYSTIVNEMKNKHVEQSA